MELVTVLGSTGSIGVNTLDVLRRFPDRYSVYALVAGSNTALLADQIREFRPRIAVVADTEAQDRLARQIADLPPNQRPELLSGSAARVAVASASEVDFVLSAIVGVAGLEATYHAIRLGKRVGLANKETLVAGGSLVMAAARASGTEILPVDSEHNGAHQCLRSGRREDVKRLILTASGGPFRNLPKTEFVHVTPAQALNHPTWKMGPRITIDSATLMNKGFEVIEACWLFDFPTSEVDVVVHPQSTVHAMIEFEDGSVMAQVSATDMRMPIQYALTYPAREDAPVPRYDFTTARTWEFYPPDFERFPCLKLAYAAQDAGGSATCTLNAADEIAVEAFLNERISFPGIASLVEETLSRVPNRTPQSVDEVLAIDAESRRTAREVVDRQAVTVGMAKG